MEEKDRFKRWLLNEERKTENTSNSYSSSINKISKHLSGERNEKIEVYSVVDLSYLKTLVELYSTKGKYSEFGHKGNGTVRSAIKAFLRFKESSNDMEEKELETTEALGITKIFSYERDLRTAMISQIAELFPEYKIFGGNDEGIDCLIEGERIDLLLEKSDEGLLAVEFKPGLANYEIFGRISMRLGLLMEKFPDREIRGCIVAGEIDQTLKSATKTTDIVSLMTYTMKLELKGE